MIDISKIDYSILDKPEVVMFLFHPRGAEESSTSNSSGLNILIPVAKDVQIGGRLHIVDQSAPNILYFHGNGEIVAEYDDLGSAYNKMGINFLPVDYRGYGLSTGQPTVTAMMQDCHVIFDFIAKWLNKNKHTGPLILMGRSLGSASAIELAYHYKNQVNGLIVESGFARLGPLLQLLGINLESIGLNDEDNSQNVNKIKEFDKPTLIIHAEKDHIIQFSNGQALYDACPAADKTLLKILQANHNDIFIRGFSEYMAAVRALADKVK